MHSEGAEYDTSNEDANAEYATLNEEVNADYATLNEGLGDKGNIAHGSRSSAMDLMPLERSVGIDDAVKTDR